MTEQEKKEIIEAIKASSTDINSLVQAATLTGILSLPGIKDGQELVSVPIELLAEPAIQAAIEAKGITAEMRLALERAQNAITEANAARDNANTKAEAAQTAADNANTATNAANEVVRTHEDIAMRARNGATAFFDGFVDDANLIPGTTLTDSGDIIFVKAKHVFASRVFIQGHYEFHNDWPSASMFMDDARQHVLAKKIFICDNVAYTLQGDILVKVEGYSSEDYTTEEKNKLGGVEEGAQKNVYVSDFGEREDASITQKKFTEECSLQKDENELLRLKAETFQKFLKETAEKGLYITDAQGNIILVYDKDGLNVAKVSDKLLKLLNAKSIEELNRFVRNTDEDGFFITDRKGNTIFKCDKNGIDAFSASPHFRELLGIKPAPLSVTFDKINKTVSFQSSLSEKYDVKNTIRFQDTHNIEGNAVMNFGGTYLQDKQSGKEFIINGEGDNIGPSYLYSLDVNGIGANHGYAHYFYVKTAAAHNKTFADIGSTWADSTNNSEWILERIVDDVTLGFLPMHTYSETYGEETMTGNLYKGRTLIHKKNATHQENIVISELNQKQYYPSVKNVRKELYLDNRKITEGGKYESSVADFYDGYEIYDFRNYVDILISKVGTLAKNPMPSDFDTETLALLEYDYRFSQGGQCVIFEDWIVLKDISVESYMALNVKPMLANTFDKECQDLMCYVPKGKALNIDLDTGKEATPESTNTKIFDFRKPSVMGGTSTINGIHWYKEDWDGNECPDRCMTIISRNSKPEIGLHFGFIFDKASGGLKRKDFSEGWYLTNFHQRNFTVYPQGFETPPVEIKQKAGNHFGSVCFRKYEDLSSLLKGYTNKSTLTIGHETYMYLDFSEIGNYNVEIPSKLRGQEFQVLEKRDNVIIANSLASNNIRIVVNKGEYDSDYAYVLIKFKK